MVLLVPDTCGPCGSGLIFPQRHAMPSELPASVLTGSYSSNRSKVDILFAAGLISVLMLLLYAPVLVSMARQWWEDPNYGHGLLVPIFAAYVLWCERKHWLASPIQPSNQGLPIMLAALGLLILGILSAEMFTARISLIILICGTVVFLSGWRRLRSVAFPVGYLTFMIPLPALVYYQLTFPLQLLASRLGARGLVLVGVHTVREGNLLVLPNITLEVVDACSGVRSLLSLLTAVVAYSYLAEDSLWRRGVLVFLTVPIVILSNGLRLVAAGGLSYIYGAEVDSGWFHATLGLVFFVAAFLAIILFHRMLRKSSSDGIPASVS
jgi:exosortase